MPVEQRCEPRVHLHVGHEQHDRRGSRLLRHRDRVDGAALIVRLLIWGLFDSKTTIDELRGSLPELEPPSTWIWNEATERFGIVLIGEDVPDGVAVARELVGHEPDVFEEFDALEL